MLYIYVTGMEKELKRDDKVQSFHNNRRFQCGTLPDVQMNHGSSNAHVQWFSPQKNGADNHDVTM